MPTNEKRPAASSEEFAGFQAFVDLINSERETLWARHNALLLANSLIIGALAISPAALWQNQWAALAMLGIDYVGTKVLSIIAVRGVLAALVEAKTLLPARKAKVAALRQEMCGWLQQKGLRYIPPQANFILIDIGRDVRTFVPELARHGVVVRPPIAGLNHMMRVSIGTDREMARFREVFWSVLKA